jgi:hypothetical protein
MAKLNPDGSRDDDYRSDNPRATGLWKESVPKKGWEWVECEDLGYYPGERCQYCRREEPRYVHTIQHPEFPFSPLRVGCVCAGELTQDYATPRKRESALKRRRQRARAHALRTEEKRLQGKWKSNGTVLIDRFNRITVFPNNGGYQIRIHLNGSYPVFRPKNGKAYRTADEARAKMVAMLAKRNVKQDDESEQSSHRSKAGTDSEWWAKVIATMGFNG